MNRRNRAIRSMLVLTLSMSITLAAGCGTGSGNSESDSDVTNSESVSTSDSSTNEDSTESSVILSTLTQEEGDALFENITISEYYKGLEDTNPVITQRYGADPCAMVYDDTVYIYSTTDVYEYDSSGNIIDNSYGTISSIGIVATTDMVNYTDYGSVNITGTMGASSWASTCWAPTAAWKEIDGEVKFFLYYANGSGGIGVLTSDSPTGPFTDPLEEALIDSETPGCEDVVWIFDPAVLVDDDGTAYLYFGGGVPDGQDANPGTARVIQLGDDMISLVGEAVEIDAPYMFEDSGIHKVGDLYYYTYCTNFNVTSEATAEYGFGSGQIVCLVSDDPMGPFTLVGTVLDNPGSVFGLYSNNHHSIFEFKGQWYITYHARTLENALGLDAGYRSTHVDKIDMEEDGTINLVEATWDGVDQVEYVDAYSENKASCFAVMGGINTVGVDKLTKNIYGSGDMALSEIDTGDFIQVRGVDFGDTSAQTISLTVRAAENVDDGNGVIQIRVDGLDGDVIGYVSVDNLTDDFVEYTAELFGTADGVHDLYFIFYGEGYEIETWSFQ